MCVRDSLSIYKMFLGCLEAWGVGGDCCLNGTGLRLKGTVTIARLERMKWVPMACGFKLSEAVEIESSRDLNLCTHLLLKAKLQSRPNTSSSKFQILYCRPKISLFSMIMASFNFYSLNIKCLKMQVVWLLNPQTNEQFLGGYTSTDCSSLLLFQNSNCKPKRNFRVPWKSFA